MRAIDGTPVDKIEQQFNVFSTEIKAINEKTQTDRKVIEDLKQKATNLARSLSESIEQFNKTIVQTETSLSQNITQKTNLLSESIKSVSDNLTTTQKELTSLIEKLNKGTTEATPEQLGARLTLLEEWQTKIDQWKKLLIEEDADQVVNTLTEIIAKFKDMPEDVGTILDLFNKKVDKTAIINDLIKGGTTDVLSAEMGKWLKDNKVDLSPNGFDKVNGNNINWNDVLFDLKGVTISSIHTPNYTGQSNYPYSGYGQLLTFGGNNLFPFQLAVYDSGLIFFRCQYVGTNDTTNFKFNAPWIRLARANEISNKIELVGLLTYTPSTGALSVTLNTIATNRFSVSNWSGGSVLVVMIDGVPCSSDYNSSYIALPFTGANMPINSQPYSIGLHGANQFTYAKYGADTAFTPTKWVSFLVFKYK